MNVMPNKECILIIHKFEVNCIFRIKSDSSSAEFARYGVIFTSAINSKSNLNDGLKAGRELRLFSYNCSSLTAFSPLFRLDFKLIAHVNITPYLANSAEDESDMIRNIV